MTGVQTCALPIFLEIILILGCVYGYLIATNIADYGDGWTEGPGRDCGIKFDKGQIK